MQEKQVFKASFSHLNLQEKKSCIERFIVNNFHGKLRNVGDYQTCKTLRNMYLTTALYPFTSE